MHPLSVKSVHVLTTFSLISGLLGTTSQSFAAGAPPVASPVESLDRYLRQEFPHTFTPESQRRYHYASLSGAAALVLLLSKVEKGLDGKLGKALQANHEMLEEAVKVRLPEIDIQIAEANAIIERNKHAVAALEDAITLQKSSSFLDVYAEAIANYQAEQSQLTADTNVLLKLQKEGSANGLSADLPETLRVVAQNNAKHRSLARLIDGVKAAQAEIQNDIASDTQKIALFTSESKQAQQQILSLETRKQTILKDLDTVAARLHSHNKLSTRLLKSGFRVVAVTASTVLLAEAATGYYVAYELGRDSKSGFYIVDLASKYEISPAVKQRFKAAIDALRLP